MGKIDFKHLILDKSFTVPVIIEFSAPSCGPCLWMENTLKEVTRELDGKVVFFSLLIEDYPTQKVKYNIKSNPTTLLLIKGELKSQLKGAFTKMIIKQWINDHSDFPHVD